MMTYDELLRKAPEIELRIDYPFKDKTLLALAFTHRSFCNENKDVSEHNERLEFLGDSILNLLIADYLYRYLPKTPEGELSYLRSRLVEASSCVLYVQKLQLESYLLLGKGERMNDGRGRDSILADLFEAIIGAIYLDGGLQAAKRFLFKNFSPEIDQILKTPVQNFKAQLQDKVQKQYKEGPVYDVIAETGPDHSKNFIITVSVQGEVIGKGEGNSKKEAQQNAAENGLKKLYGD
ncbi:MAG: ribonuclease III [Chlamydiia bacterium]|nr:ribonuclease III [Chlamydiia bacterium]